MQCSKTAQNTIMSKDDFVTYPTLTPAEQQQPIMTSGYASSAIASTFTANPSPVSQQGNGSPCAMCGERVDMNFSNRRPFVYMSCAHLMHIKCFSELIAKTPLSEDCNENFGGPKSCVRCLSKIPVGFQSEVLFDREEILREFRVGFSNNYGAYNGPSDDEDLTQEQKRAILGIKPSLLFSDKTDYSSYGRRAGCKRSDELVEILKERNRTLEDIFAVPKINAHHLFKMGINSMEDFVKLGYNSVTHGTKAYRDRCPYWMLSDLFSFDKDFVFKNHTADSLLAVNYKPKELWLCGVSMQTLIDNRLTKKAFLLYKANPIDVVKFLELTQVHLNRLGVTRAEMSVDWNNASLTDPKIKVILDSLKK